LSEYEPNNFQEVGGVWKLALEWDAIQPQRLRLIKPIVFVASPDAAQLEVKARIYSDSFPAPYELHATLNIDVVDSPTDLKILLPDWSEIIRSSGSKQKLENLIPFPDQKQSEN
jgi:hypothetical protein